MNLLHTKLADLVSDNTSNAKSSAGDKHETAVSMMQLEQEKINNQLKIYDEQLKVLDVINPENVSSLIGLGSLIVTSRQLIYISVGIGKIQYPAGAGTELIIISLQAPLAQALKGKCVNESVEFNKIRYAIESLH